METDLRLAGKLVSRCYVDFAFGLLFFDQDGEGETEIRIGGLFRLKGHDHERLLSAEVNLEEVGTAVVVFNQTVARAFALEDGTLDMSFTDGTTLTVPPDPNYEAWTFSDPHGFQVVSLPGGGLAIWAPEQ